jgi:hypothetical protein
MIGQSDEDTLRVCFVLKVLVRAFRDPLSRAEFTAFSGVAGTRQLQTNCTITDQDANTD